MISVRAMRHACWTIQGRAILSVRLVLDFLQHLLWEIKRLLSFYQYSPSILTRPASVFCDLGHHGADRSWCQAAHMVRRGRATGEVGRAASDPIGLAVRNAECGCAVGNASAWRGVALPTRSDVEFFGLHHRGALHDELKTWRCVLAHRDCIVASHPSSEHDTDSGGASGSSVVALSRRRPSRRDRRLASAFAFSGDFAMTASRSASSSAQYVSPPSRAIERRLRQKIAHLRSIPAGVWQNVRSSVAM